MSGGLPDFTLLGGLLGDAAVAAHLTAAAELRAMLDFEAALARAQASRGDATQAVELLSRSIELAPEDSRLRVELGRQLIASGQDAEALKAYADLLDSLERIADSRARVGGES